MKLVKNTMTARKTYRLLLDRMRDNKMMILRHLRFVPAFIVLIFALVGMVPVRAQEALPRPAPLFKGHVGLTPKDSTLNFPQEATRFLGYCGGVRQALADLPLKLPIFLHSPRTNAQLCLSVSHSSI